MGRLIGLSLLFLILFGGTISLFVWRPAVRYGGRERYDASAGKYVRDETSAHSMWYLGFVPLVIGLILFASTSLTSVHAHNEGVLLSMGKPSGRILNPGGHWKWYWQSVEQIDGTNKTDNFNGGDKTSEANTVNHGAVSVRLADGNTAEAYVSIRWSAVPGQANRIYSQYRGSDPIDQMRNNLLIPNLRQVVNDVLGTYSPTQALDGLNVDFTDPSSLTQIEGLKFNPDFEKLTSEIKSGMDSKLATNGPALIQVEQVTFSFLKLPDVTQNKINAFLTEVNNARIALAKQATNTAQAAANNILADSLAKNPNVLVAQCYDLINEGKLNPPAGFSCWPGSGSAVVVPSAPVTN